MDLRGLNSELNAFDLIWFDLYGHCVYRSIGPVKFGHRLLRGSPCLFIDSDSRNSRRLVISALCNCRIFIYAL